MSVIRSYFFCFLAIDNDIMRKMCTLITSKGTDFDENIANQNHATRTRVHRNRGILTSLILKANVSHLSRGSDILNLNANFKSGCL